MDIKKTVGLLEMLQKQLDHGSTGAANQKKAAQTGKASTSHARAKVKELMQLNKKSRTDATRIDAKRGYPSVSSQRESVDLAETVPSPVKKDRFRKANANYRDAERDDPVIANWKKKDIRFNRKVIGVDKLKQRQDHGGIKNEPSNAKDPGYPSWAKYHKYMK